MEDSLLPQLNIKTFASQIFWLCIIFCVFYFYIKNIVSPYFYKVIDSRALFITNNINDIKRLQKKANFLFDEYKERLQASYLKGDDILQDTKRKMQKKSHDIRQKYNEDLHAKFLNEKNSLKEQFKVEDDVFIESCHTLISQSADKLGISITSNVTEEIKHLLLKEVK